MFLSIEKPGKQSITRQSLVPAKQTIQKKALLITFSIFFATQKQSKVLKVALLIIYYCADWQVERKELGLYNYM
eukprot:UN14106